MFLLQLVIGAALVTLTVLIHAVVLDRVLFYLEIFSPYIFKLTRKLWKICILVVTVWSVFLAHVVQIWLWAFVYMSVLPHFTLESALYFSTSTFTTVGYGDIVIDSDWRLLSSFQAANGFLLFGWSTAFIFEIMSKLYRGDTIRKYEDHRVI